MDKRINILPAPTWNSLSVNAAEGVFALPETPSALSSGHAAFTLQHDPLPSGICEIARIDDPCAVSEDFRLSENVQDVSLKPAPAYFESGIGAYFDAFVKEHAAACCFLGTNGGSSETVRTSIRLAEGEAASTAAEAFWFQLSAEAGETISLLQHIETEDNAADDKTLAEGEHDAASAAAPDGSKESAADISTLTEIFAKKDAHVRLYQVETASDAAKVRQGVIIHGEEGAQVEVIRVILGGAASACGTRAYLTGKRSSFQLKTVYFASGTQAFDFNDIADHRGKDTVSDLYTAGVLAGKSRKTLRGTIDFKEGAVHAVGHETEDVLLLSNGVRNRTVPLILCGEENVEGQHAASSGKPDARKLYYLRSRGLSEQEAAKLLIEGRFAPVLDQIPDPAMREYLGQKIERRLNAYEEISR